MCFSPVSNWIVLQQFCPPPPPAFQSLSGKQARFGLWVRFIFCALPLPPPPYTHTHTHLHIPPHPHFLASRFSVLRNVSPVNAWKRVFHLQQISSQNLALLHSHVLNLSECYCIKSLLSLHKWAQMVGTYFCVIQWKNYGSLGAVHEWFGLWCLH